MNTNQEISLDELISGIKNFIFCLDLYKEKINNLNVFPVPDGCLVICWELNCVV